jgi:pantoate--beta-alanine ligase
MVQFTTAKELKEFLRERRRRGSTIGFIPTMGALHEGHLSMVRRSKKENGLTVVSIFVNPTQFNNPSDLERYPRTPEKDIRLLVCEDCDILFAPGAEEMYPPDEITPEIDLGALDRVMEGKFRPGHFQGVATVVKKFFDIIEPDVAYFGKKDFQQLAVITHMVRTLSLPVRIVPSETVREPDGVAMSSRNLRLPAADREAARGIHDTLLRVRSAAGTVPPAELAKKAFSELAALPRFRPEYFEIVDGETLLPLGKWQKGRLAVACTAVYLGDIRLIDNLEVFS